MKYFISQPMNGKTEEEISSTRELIIYLIKEYDESAEIVSSYINPATSENLSSLELLSRSISVLSNCDCIVIPETKPLPRGCGIEYKCAQEYGIKILEYSKDFTTLNDPSLVKKPPLGITPRYIIDEDRFTEICKAISRYSKESIQIPDEWLFELKEVLERIVDRKNKE